MTKDTWRVQYEDRDAFLEPTADGGMFATVVADPTYRVAQLSSTEGLEAQVGRYKVSLSLAGHYQDDENSKIDVPIFQLVLVQTQGVFSEQKQASADTITGVLDAAFDDIYSFELLGESFTAKPSELTSVQRDASSVYTVKYHLKKVFDIPRKIVKFVLDELSSGEEGTSTQDNMFVLLVGKFPENSRGNIRLQAVNEIHFRMAPRRMQINLRK